MSSKTKIVVLRGKELLYTGIFAILFLLFIVLLVIMFSPNHNDETAETMSSSVYQPGVYTSSIQLNGQSVDIEVTVDETNITSIKLVNLDEAITTMYPLIEPAFEELAAQIKENQSLENITYSDDNKYTSMVLLDAITSSIEKAKEQQP